MGFQPKEALEGAQPASQSSLPFLAPDPKNPTLKMEPALAQRHTEEARKKTLRTLNTIKTVSPIMSALIERQASSGSEEEAVALFKRLVGQASDAAELVMTEMGEDPVDPANFWMRNVLERAFCEMLRDQVQRGREGSLRPLEPTLRALAKMEWRQPEGSQPFETWAADTSARAALARAAAPILSKASAFDFFRKDLDKDLEQILRGIMEKARMATQELVDPAAGEKERASLFSMLVGEAGLLYASAWQACGKPVVANLSSLKDAQLNALLAEHPDGLPLDKVQEVFDKNFSRMVSLSSRLVPQKAGKLEARLKTERPKK
jgi:hypothetical protein